MRNYDWKYKFEKRKAKEHSKELRAGGFTCSHCRKFVIINDFMGTAHRNHCNYCLWSKHVDLYKPGDRKATCRGGMKPIGLAFKDEGYDKYGKKKQGELKLVHWCTVDMALSTNRIAADDDTDAVFSILYQSQNITNDIQRQLNANAIILLDDSDAMEIRNLLFGKGY